MAKIIDRETSDKIRKLRADKECVKIKKRGWMCEGTDDGLVFFNNNTEECVEVDINGNVITSRNMFKTPLSAIEPFIKVECEIARLVL
ncbi:MAG: hypothetical protein IJK26_10070 [Clostridia bacterium]|nr:hypothetical protein [Clostridia bacterium]